MARMRYPSRFWADLSARDFAQAQASGLAAQTVAVLPVAAVERMGRTCRCRSMPRCWPV